MAINLKDILDYVTPEPRYTGELKNLGLITAGDLEKARNQSIFQGLLGAGLNYLAQPKNMGYGSAVPYLAKAGIAGLQAAERPYEKLKEDVLMKEKLRELQYEKAQREKQRLKEEDIQSIYKKGLLKDTRTSQSALPSAPEYTTLPSGEVSPRPVFNVTKRPDIVSTGTNWDTINELISKGYIDEAENAMGLAKLQKELTAPAEIESKTVGGKLVFFKKGTDQIVKEVDYNTDKLEQKRVLKRSLASDGTVMEQPLIERKVNGQIVGYEEIEGEGAYPRNEMKIGIAQPPRQVTEASIKVTKKQIQQLYPDYDITNLDNNKAAYIEDLANQLINRPEARANNLSKIQAIKLIIDQTKMLEKADDIVDVGSPNYRLVIPKTPPTINYGDVVDWNDLG